MLKVTFYVDENQDDLYESICGLTIDELQSESRDLETTSPVALVWRAFSKTEYVKGDLTVTAVNT